MTVVREDGIDERETQAVLRDVGEAVARDDLARASQIADNAIRRGARHPALFNARALQSQQQDRHDAALADFQSALAFMPREPALLNAIGLSLVRLNRANEAIAHFDTAISIAPAVALTHFRKGWAYEAAGELTKAIPCYERAVALEPAYPDPLASLAVILARRGQRAKARDLAQRALRIDPSHPTGVIAVTIIEIADRAFLPAEERLRQGLMDARAVGHTRAVLLGLLGDALDGQERYREAFAAYTEENEELRKLHGPRFSGQRRMTSVIEELGSNFAATPAARWQDHDQDAPTPENGPREHVFLLGFLRSGTTLLEQVLAIHPDIANLEERETLVDAARTYLTDKTGLDRLAGLNGVDLEQARAKYWRRVREYGAEVSGKVFIDKQPLNTFNLPLIAKLFPKAKILFALRDPRDVVFSCFRRHFDVNATVFELLSLEDAAHFYAAVMSLSDLCREKLPLHLFEHRYEDMVEDFEGRVRAVCGFIGVAWTDAMRDFAQSAREQTIRSPSAQQVRRGLYSEGVAQWRNYRKDLSPMLPILRPWVERFNYPPD